MKGYVLGLALTLAAGTPLAQTPSAGEVWPDIRRGLFAERTIVEDDGARITLSLPERAADASTVPLSIRVHMLPGDAPVRRLYLVIDKNPSPVGAIFEFAAAGRAATLETRVRIEDYTWVRAIAETADGALFAARRFIKASGGCSAPAGKNLAERMIGVGQMKWRVDAPANDGGQTGQTMVQLLIRHPNNSGLAMDQLTRLYDPPYFVRSVTVERGGQTVFAAQVDFTISENPAFRFSLPAAGDGDLRAVVVDTDERVFESRAAFTPEARD